VSPGDPIRKLVKRAIRATTARSGLVVTAGVRGSSQTRLGGGDDGSGGGSGGGGSSRSRAVCAEAQEASGRRRLEHTEGPRRDSGFTHTDTRPPACTSHGHATMRAQVARVRVCPYTRRVSVAEHA